MQLPATLDSARDVDLVAEFIRQHMQRSLGSRVGVKVIYEHFADWWAEHGGDTKPLTAREFGAALRAICQKVSIRVKKRGGKVLCCDVRLMQ